MPIYEYRCGSCGHEVEALQKLSDPALTDCPACRKASLTKLVSAAGFQLKGSGWYATDFRNGSKPAAAKDGAKPETATPDAKPAGDSGASESKSDGKSEGTASASAGSCGTSCACH